MAQIARTDFLLNIVDKNNETVFLKDGDFPLQDTVVGGVFIDTPFGFSDQQHIQDIIVFSKGSLKQFPTLGFSLKSYTSSEFDLTKINNNLTAEMKSDGYAIKTGCVSPVKGGGFNIDTSKIYRK